MWRSATDGVSPFVAALALRDRPEIAGRKGSSGQISAGLAKALFRRGDRASVWTYDRGEHNAVTELLSPNCLDCEGSGPRSLPDGTLAYIAI